MTDNDFIDFINANEPEVSILGITFSPGQVLKEMDPITFSCFKSDYEGNMEEDDGQPDEAQEWESFDADC